MKNALTLEKLEKLILAGDIDTVLVAFPDHLGRLMGKRVTGSHFLDHLVPDGMESCDYLLTVDIDTGLVESVRKTLPVLGNRRQF